jgi:hypothetical protein
MILPALLPVTSVRDTISDGTTPDGPCAFAPPCPDCHTALALAWVRR